MTTYHAVGLETFASKMKFGLSDRVDQFVQYCEMFEKADKCQTSEEWAKLFIKWTQSGKDLRDYLASTL